MGKKGGKIRLIISICLILGVFTVLGARLVKLQLVDGKKYEAAGMASSSNTATVKAARGEILDRNGNPLVINRQGNSIIFDAAYFPSAKKQSERDSIILKLINIIESQNETWIDNLPLVFDSSGKIVFAENRESDIKKMKSKDMLNLNEYATAQNCMDALVAKYSLQNYSKVNARKIASVCYEMDNLDFAVNQPYTFAEDVATNTVSMVKENSDIFPGVDVQIVPYREYVDGTIAPHILGTVGALDAKEYKENKDKGYKLNDSIGKSGIERAMESYLKGTDGKKSITTDFQGNTNSKYLTDPVQGNTVILTIDKNLQKVAQDALKNAVQRTSSDSAGAVVVTDVKSGEILAMASYPTYDISKYNKEAAQLNKASGSPLWNRATMSTYACGSTMKPAMALAGLSEGVITKDSIITCRRYYTYKNQTFKCLGYHGSINVKQALLHSCNIFFYEVGRRLGIDKIDEYAKKLGLGEKTGIEISEASGTMASPAEREARGGVWYPGDTIQAAIGQSDDQFTPLQLADYVSTIASGGTRYQPHLVKSVKSYDLSKTMLEKNPVVMAKLNVSKENLQTVKEGMFEVGTQGTVGRKFRNLPIKASAKTGTAQVVEYKNGTKIYHTNGLLITFAPYDNPEIAISLIVEDAGTGSSVSDIAADIYNYYFTERGKGESAVSEDVLLK